MPPTGGANIGAIVVAVGHKGGDWREGRHVERGVQAPIGLIQLQDDGWGERKLLVVIGKQAMISRLAETEP